MAIFVESCPFYMYPGPFTKEPVFLHVHTARLAHVWHVLLFLVRDRIESSKIDRIESTNHIDPYYPKMRVLNFCLALALSSAAGPSLVSAAKQAKVKANTVNAPPPASFVLTDKVAALSPSEKHRLEQLLLISGRYDLSLNVNIEDAVEAVEGSDNTSIE